MRNKRRSDLDVYENDQSDLLGPSWEVFLDRMIGEGVIELPVECRDPLDILIELETAQPAVMPDMVTAAEMPRHFHPTASGRVVSWHRFGYEPNDFDSLKVLYS